MSERHNKKKHRKLKCDASFYIMATRKMDIALVRMDL